MRRLIEIIIIALSLLFLPGCERAITKFDREVDRLCAIDGGVHVYEKVVLLKENFDKRGDLTKEFIDSIGFAQIKGEFYQHGSEIHEIAYKSPFLPFRSGISMEKRTRYIIRHADGKVLGEFITYGRGGGYSIIPPWDIRYTCPEHASSTLLRDIFVSE